jgi:divalent metal cation (Fe/Co/Zn/Cd) transporter
VSKAVLEFSSGFLLVAGAFIMFLAIVKVSLPIDVPLLGIGIVFVSLALTFWDKAKTRGQK